MCFNNQDIEADKAKMRDGIELLLASKVNGNSPVFFLLKKCIKTASLYQHIAIIAVICSGIY